MKRISMAVLIVLLMALPLAVQAEEPTVSMVFVQNDLRDAVTELILQTGVNIILDDAVQGVVTLDLIDVPLSQALKMLTLAGGYEVHKIDDFYFIGSSDPASLSFKSFAKTETYELKYISSQSVGDLIPEMYRNYVKTGMSSNIVTITAPPTMLQQIRELLDQLDRPTPQILIQALVTEISRSELDEWGAGLLSYDSSGERGDSWLDHIAYENTVFNFGIFGRVLSSLRALEAEQKAEIRANPRVVTASGKTVDLFSGETHFVALSATGTSSSRLEEIDVGVSLNVTPRVVQGNILQISIEPEISHMSDRLGSGESFSVRRSSVSTDVFAESGQTLLLAGMTLENTSNQDSHVPILGRLPLVRWFFTDKSDSQEERELLIFVTAEILPTNQTGAF